MRINRLDLIRYGKFTGRTVDLPHAERDFHVIVGANEAGKSTIRSAIQDLLYGIPKNTVHGFLHQMSDMRLGGFIEHGGDSLEFHRSKGNSKTLRSAADAVLPDGALGAFLGTTDREFFAKMFGLDHTRLVAGGHSILSASDDLGQILFQSAAGIGSLGVIRAALEAEADKLWSKRKSNDRAYYIAAQELENAVAALKAATVRTKDWALAQAKVTELESVEAQAKESHAAIKTRRSLLERVRRVAPHLHGLDAVSNQLAELGVTADLPESASKTLVDAEKEEAAAHADQRHHHELVESAQSALAGIVVDSRLLGGAVEVTELNERRLQYRAYGGDMARRQAEVDAQWGIAAGLAAQLGWDTLSEAAVQQHMPKLAVRTAIEGLTRTHAPLQQALVAAERAQRTKVAEIEQARLALAELPISDIPMGLQASVAQAQKLGDFLALAEARQELVQKRAREEDAAYAALGQWRSDPTVLGAMTAPSEDSIKAFSQEQLSDDAEAKAVATHSQTLARQIKQLELEIDQFREAHHPVTRDELLGVRQAREAAWELIKASPAAQPTQSAEYEKLVVGADTLADVRHDKVQQSSELQATQQQLERLKLDAKAANENAQRLMDATAARMTRWAGLALECGLPSLSFQASVPWLYARKKALDATQALAEANNSFISHETACASACAVLVKELASLGQNVGDEPLAALLLHADGLVQTVVDARGQRKSLVKQKSDAEQALIPLNEAVTSAKSDMDAWIANWTQALARACLPHQDDVGMVGGILTVMSQIDAGLAAMGKTRVERLDTMRADLVMQAKEAQALAERLAPDLVGESAEAIALELLNRLTAAKDASIEMKRQTLALESAQGMVQKAKSRLQLAQAQLAPLFEHSSATSNAELAEAIAKSDKRRLLFLAAAESEKAIQDSGDALTRDSLRVEASTVDAAALLIELEELISQDEQLVNHRSDLAAKKQAATALVDAIGGSADAARAEGQRQEALAKMAEAVARYIKVYTAARLLKWSIEQYREEKQGPMLALASNIFSRLTRGSFERLTVDFESEPLKLQGRRPDGSVVGIDGLSEGTRDQLFLALRLAALDMHVGQAHSLPFIADDLFINYDDQRSMAGLEALGELSRKTQVVFLTHHDHLLPAVRQVFGVGVNVVNLSN